MRWTWTWRPDASPRRPAGKSILPGVCSCCITWPFGSRPEQLAPEIVFADLPMARTYARVYQERAIGRLCATVGRDAEKLRRAATALGGRAVAGGDAAFEFDVLPRLRLRLIWHEADEEFSPSATILLPANIESYFCIEDIVVLSERVVAWLAGRGL